MVIFACASFFLVFVSRNKKKSQGLKALRNIKQCLKSANVKDFNNPINVSQSSPINSQSIKKFT